MENQAKSSEELVLEAVQAVVGSFPEEYQARIGTFMARLRSAGDPDPNATEILGAIRRLWGLYETQEFPEAFDIRLFIALGWWNTVNRQALAITTLFDAGLSSEAIPVARSAFEHAIALSLISYDDGSKLATGVTASTLADFRKAFEALERLDPDLPGVDVRSGVFEVVTEEPWPKLISNQLTRLGIKDQAYPAYQGLCTFSHPTLAGVLGYANWFDNFKLTKSPQLWMLDGPAGRPLLWAIQSQCWAALAIDRVLNDGLPWLDAVEEVIDALDVPLVEKLRAGPEAI